MPDLPLSLLVVEDDPGDAELIRHAFRRASTEVRAEIALDGETALVWLLEAARGERPLPDLVLLDLNMPRMDGHELLGRLRAQAPLAGLPILVLSTSAAPGDRRRALAAHANAYLVKPPTLDGFVRLAETVIAFWGDYATGWSTAGGPPQDGRSQ